MHFWLILNELQTTTVNDRYHTVSTKENADVVTNMAIAISTKDLHKQCITKAKSQGIQEEQTLSLV